MGQQQNKYHVSDDGNIYRVNEDGSFTSMGNVEERSRKYDSIIQCENKSKNESNSTPQKNQPYAAVNQQQPHNQPSQKKNTIGTIFVTLMYFIGLAMFLSAIILKFDGYLFIQIFGGGICILATLIKLQIDKKQQKYPKN